MYLDLASELGDSPQAQQLAAMRASGREVPEIVYLLSARPEWTAGLMEFTSGVMRGPGGLPTWQRELIAALTSRWNRCDFCMKSHGPASAVLMEDAGIKDGAAIVAAVLADPLTAPVPERDRLLYSAVELFVARRHELNQAVVDGLLAAGWQTSDIFETTTICALFCFFNCWVSSNGVADMSDAAYQASGRSLAHGNYQPSRPAAGGG